ncbi:MAG TPA: hypothetical protein VMB66_12725 [Candidatus Acidoferrales bacterium]|nr:hypothetical protein [Candidatus Acidoferrales bacterium]
MRQPRYFHLISLIALLLCYFWPLQSLSQESRSAAVIGAGQPQSIHFKSTLLAEDGEPLAGLHLLTFYIHASEEFPDDSFWSETLPVQSDGNGNYSVDLTPPARAIAANVLEQHPVLYVSTSIPGSSSFSEAHVITTIPQAIYQDCNLDGQSCSGAAGDTPSSQLDKIADANFSVVLNYSVFWGTKKELLAYAAHAHARHLKIMWAFNDPDFAKYSDKGGKYLIDDYSEISASCHCSTNRGFLEYLVNLVKNLPATYGYSIGDEPTPNTASNVQNLYNIIRGLDSKHPQMVNATWDDATNPSLADLRRYLVPFHFADILGGDYYPIGTGAPASDTATAASDVFAIATKYGKATEMALQAFNWGQYPGAGVCSGSQCTYPTARQLETMLHDAVTGANPAIIFWYDYWDTVNAGQWANFVRAVNPQRP